MKSAALTDRQVEVLRLVHRGMTIRDMGDVLNIASTKGVSDHLVLLHKKGAIEAGAGRGARARWKLTVYGLICIGLAPCPTCKGCGTVQA